MPISDPIPAAASVSAAVLAQRLAPVAAADPMSDADPVPRPGPAGGEPASAGRLVVVRHGETLWSQTGRHTGTTDIPLLPAGEQQAVGLRARLAGGTFASVLVSPLGRARRTCELAGFGDVAVVCRDLAEWDYGDVEGRTSAEVRSERPGWVLWRDGVRGGETLQEVADRADRVVAAARAVEGDTLVFAHGHVIRVLAARWLGLGPETGANFMVGPAAVGVLGWERQTPAVSRWNLSDGDVFGAS